MKDLVLHFQEFLQKEKYRYLYFIEIKLYKM